MQYNYAFKTGLAKILIPYLRNQNMGMSAVKGSFHEKLGG
jgi:hypothetical protein